MAVFLPVLGWQHSVEPAAAFQAACIEIHMSHAERIASKNACRWDIQPAISSDYALQSVTCQVLGMIVALCIGDAVCWPKLNITIRRFNSIGAAVQI